MGLGGVGLVEGFGVDDEVQFATSVVALHALFNVVAAAVGDHGLVAVGVVHFGVYDILQRGDFGKTLVEHVEQGEEPLLVVVGNNDDDHPLAGAGVADNEVAQESCMVTDVVVVKVVGLGILAHGETDGVAGVLLQSAMLDVEHLVEKLGDVESQGPPMVVILRSGRVGLPCFG